MTTPTNQRRIAIIGGGITGLSAATKITKDHADWLVDLYEAESKWGGVLQTKQTDGFLIEQSADSFLDTPQQPWAGELIRCIGLEDELIGTDERFRRARVYFNGRGHEIPSGFQLMAASKTLPVLRSSLLSIRGKARLLMEPLIPRSQEEGEESLAQFAKRRVGAEAYARLVQPLVSGIYTADPEKLCVQAALPRFSKWERELGSLTAGLIAQSRARDNTNHGTAGARYAEFRTLKRGLGSLIERVVRMLEEHHSARLHLNSPVTAIRRTDDGWQLDMQDGFERYDAVILATAPHVAGELVQPGSARLHSLLTGFESASVAIISVGFAKEQLAAPLDCFGLVVPLAAHRDVIAASFSSVKFPGRAPDDHELVRVFVGGACHPDLLLRDDQALKQLAIRELQDLIGLSGKPALCEITRWTARTPQYHIGHRDRSAAIEDCLSDLPQLAIAGNAYGGIGIPHCVRSGEQAADRIKNVLER